MSAPAVAVSAKHNKLVVAWKDVRTGEPNIYWSVSDTKSFRKGTAVHNALKGKQDHPSATIDSTGKAWLAWEDSSSGKHEIRVRSEDDGSEAVISAEPNTSFPVIASGAGSVAVAYESRAGDARTIRFKLIHDDRKLDR